MLCVSFLLLFPVVWGGSYVVRQPGRKTRAHSYDDHDVASKAIEETIFVVVSTVRWNYSQRFDIARGVKYVG